MTAGEVELASMLAVAENHIRTLEQEIKRMQEVLMVAHKRLSLRVAKCGCQRKCGLCVDDVQFLGLE